MLLMNGILILIMVIISSIFKEPPELTALIPNLGNLEGDTCVGNVDLLKEWNSGCKKTLAIMEEYFGPKFALDFIQIFFQPKHDILQPMGDYIGIKASADEMMLDLKKKFFQQLYLTIKPWEILPPCRMSWLIHQPTYPCSQTTSPPPGTFLGLLLKKSKKTTIPSRIWQ